MPLAYLQELCTEWAEEYDWRATEARLNAIPQFTTEIDGLAASTSCTSAPRTADALPLVLTHGWPGSVLEFEAAARSRSPRPEDPADAFHVVVPSLPGYGFSGKPGGAGLGRGADRRARGRR